MGFAQSAGEEERLEEGRKLRAVGRYTEAKNTFTALLKESEQQNRQGVFSSRVLDELAVTEQDLGNFAAAERLLNRSIAILPNLAAEGHLGEVYLEERRPREAEPLFRRVLAARQNASPPDPTATAVAMVDLAAVYGNTGRLRQSERMLRQALAMLEEQFSPDHPMLSAALGPLGVALSREHKYGEALAVTERAWQILRENPRVAAPDLLNTMSSLAALYSLTGNMSEAELYAKDLTARAEAIYGPDHPRFGWCLANYAAILGRMGRKDEARAMEKRSAAILARSEEANPVRHSVNVNALR